MAWFGEAFGDSLNSIKGQITKITKEVLADEEASGNDSKPDLLVKELQALCESKDLEIASLRDEFNKLQYQHESLKNENKQTFDGDVRKQLSELREERDHLNSCIDELQSEHQVNLNQVISIRDAYKTELEQLKNEYASLKAKYDEVVDKKPQNDEFTSLTAKIQQLELELHECQKGSNNEIEKLTKDIEVLNKEKQETDDKYTKIKFENDELQAKINLLENETKENSIKTQVLVNEKEELLKKCDKLIELERMVSNLEETKTKIYKNLVNISGASDGDDIFKIIQILENNLKSKHTNNEVNLEMEKLKDENDSLKNNLKLTTDKRLEMEKKYEEEIAALKKSLSELKTQQQDWINQSQTDDVKRLEQEVTQFMNLLMVKNNEINDYSKSIKNLEEELRSLKTAANKTEEELSALKKEKTTVEEEMQCLKNLNININHEKNNLEEMIKNMQTENTNLTEENNKLNARVQELQEQNSNLNSNNETTLLQAELNKVIISKGELEKLCQELQTTIANLKNELENSKAQVIIRESNIGELMKANSYFQEEVNKLQTQNNQLMGLEKEIQKWKNASVDLEIQCQDLTSKKEELESECLTLRTQLELLPVKDAEIQQLSLTNANLAQTCNQLHYQLENKAQMEHSLITKDTELESKCQKQSHMISELQEENNELKSRIQKFQEQLKTQLDNQTIKEDIQQHRRSKSASVEVSEIQKPSEDINEVKQTLKQEQIRIKSLQQQLQEMSDREANARKEFERLKQHLIEVEDHYTEEAVENEKIMNDLKSKLLAAEEQLQNSSTLYTSLKVRDSQHVESLQNQLRMVSAQRDDFQAKLSATEDEIQKHKASLMSLQIVLEQFQEDKKQEIEEVAMKYEKQLQQTHFRFNELEAEIEGLKRQLTEAKNGLKAASRLGEQLEKKTQQVTELEESVTSLNGKLQELEKTLTIANQTNNGKIEKSLIKNLVLGYVLSPNGERKLQVLKIIASVLDFNQEERDKMGVDATQSGWLSNILHPKGGGPPSSQSLSEAFIKFLENESRPQPQFKLLPEQVQASTSRTSPKPGRLPELILPTFNSSQENESSIILQNVLKDS